MAFNKSMKVVTISIFLILMGTMVSSGFNKVFDYQGLNNEQAEPINMDKAKFYPDDDTCIRQGTPDDPGGDGNEINIRDEGWAGRWSGLVKFDISSIPSGTIIASAELCLYYNRWSDNNPVGRPLYVHRLLNNWDESTACWNNQPSHSSSVTNIQYVPESTDVWMTWDVTEDIQDMVNGTYSNYGWIIIDPTPTVVNSPITRFCSKEYGTDSPYLDITLQQESDPPQTPTTPTGPISTEVGETASYQTSCIDPNDDTIQYRFDWGDGSYSSWSELIPSGDVFTIEHTFNNDGYFSIKAQAMDQYGAQSGWSNGLIVTVEPISNPPSKPSTPSGPSNVMVGQSVLFETLSYDPDGDDIKYRFSWGDGSYSSWSEYVSSGDPFSIQHTFDAGGVFAIRCQAKDEYDIKSKWSDELLVTVSDNQAPDIPTPPSGDLILEISQTGVYETSSDDPDEDLIQYRFDWGDGSYSGWSDFVGSGQSVSMEHEWLVAGTYELSAQCKDENGAESDWSESTNIQILEQNVPPQNPFISGPTNGKIGESNVYSIFSVDENEDELFFYIDWGDGDVEGWIGPYDSLETFNITHTWEEKDTYQVQVKVKDEHGAESGWAALEVTMPLTPDNPWLSLILDIVEFLKSSFRWHEFFDFVSFLP